MEAKKNPAQTKSPQNRPKATTSAILGKAPVEVLIDPKWEQQYRGLLELRDQLRRQKGQLVQAAAEVYTGTRRDPADVGTNTYDCDWALGMASSDQNALYEIDEALDRIRAGTYGICQLTGQLISQERLEAIPWTRFSTEAEHELEASGQLGRARLGLRESLGDEGEAGETSDEGDEPKQTSTEA